MSAPDAQRPHPARGGVRPPVGSASPGGSGGSDRVDVTGRAHKALASAPRRAGRRRKLGTADYQALGAFRLALRRFLAFSEAEARSLGLTPRQHQALLVVRSHGGPGPLSVGELAESLLIKNHSAVGLVERLVERGMLTRGPAAQDRRRIELCLTRAGQAALEAISRRNLSKLKRTVPVFTDLMASLAQLDLPPPQLRRAEAPLRRLRPTGKED